jgi:hypothetical protein
MHFTPTSSSWLNLVERWFRDLTDKRIRRGTFTNVAKLEAAIQSYIDEHNQNPNSPWRKSFDGRGMTRAGEPMGVTEDGDGDGQAEAGRARRVMDRGQ